MIRRLPMVLLALAVLGIGLSGCYEDSDVTMFEPHHYKGRSDPLLAKLQKDDLQQTLQARFKQVQTDR